MTRILVCGGRDYEDWMFLTRSLDAIHLDRRITCVIHGAARGADTMAGDWAKSRDIPVEEYPVSKKDWHDLGKRAGHIRNARMLKLGRPDEVVAFPGGRGTADMVTKAFEAGVKLTILKT